MAEMEIPRNIFSRYDSQSRHRRRMLDVLTEKEANNTLITIKMEPSTECTPETCETRPIPQNCKICLPVGQLVSGEDMKFLGMKDCFMPLTMSPYNYCWIRMFPFYNYYLNFSLGPLYKIPNLKDVEEDQTFILDPLILENPLIKGIDVDTCTIKKDVVQRLNNIQVSALWKPLLSSFVRFSSWVTQKLLSMQFETIFVHEAQLEMLKLVQSTHLPVIFIPTCRSDWDTTLLLWTLVHHGIKNPFFVSGHKANRRLTKYFGGIGEIFNKLRSKDINSELKYSAAISAYLRLILRAGNNLMFNVERERSRTGRPSAEVYGTEILRIIYEDYKQGKIEDVYFVPVSFSYELIPDIDSLIEPSKAQNSIKSFMNPLRYIKNFRRRISNWIWFKKARVKIDFAHPFCIREFDNSMKRNPKIQRVLAAEANNEICESYHRSRDCGLLRWNSSDSINSVSSLYGELSPLYPIDKDSIDKQSRLAASLDILNLHILYDASVSESIMPTHLLAFVLIKKFRNGVTLDILKSEISSLMQFLTLNKRDYGFAYRDCDIEALIVHAITLLRADIMVQYNAENICTIAPSSNINSLRRLDYYANYVFPGFVMMSIVATAIFSLCGTQLMTMKGFDLDISVRDEDFIHHCRRIYGLFVGAFLLHPPCVTAETGIRKSVNDMVNAGHFTLIMARNRNYDWDDDYSDNDYPPVQTTQAEMLTEQEFSFAPEKLQIVASTATIETLYFYRSMLIPYLEIYAVIASKLKLLLEVEGDYKEIEITKFQNLLLSSLMELSQTDFRSFGELLNMSTVKAFLVTCQEHGILYTHVDQQTFVRSYGLENNYCKQDAIDKLVADILYYVTN